MPWEPDRSPGRRTASIAVDDGTAGNVSLTGRRSGRGLVRGKRLPQLLGQLLWFGEDLSQGDPAVGVGDGLPRNQDRVAVQPLHDDADQPGASSGAAVVAEQ